MITPSIDKENTCKEICISDKVDQTYEESELGTEEPWSHNSTKQLYCVDSVN